MPEKPIGNPELFRSNGEVGVSSITYSSWTRAIRQEAQQKKMVPFGVLLPGLYEYSLHFPRATRRARMSEYLDSLGIQRSDCREEICGLLDDCDNRLSMPVLLRDKVPNLSGVVKSQRVEVGREKPGRERWLPFFVFRDALHVTVSATPNTSVNMIYRGTDQTFLSEVQNQAAFLHDVYGYTFSFFDVKGENEERLNRLQEAGKLQLSKWYTHRKEFYRAYTLSKKNIKEVFRTFVHPIDTQNGASMLDKMNELLVLFAGATVGYSGGYRTKEKRLSMFIDYKFGERSLQQLNEGTTSMVNNTTFREIMKRLNANKTEIIHRYGDIFSHIQSPYIREYERYLDRTQFTLSDETGEVKLVEVPSNF